ncbi:MAG: hypothetical protein JXB47_13675, partial [Anaerolineae bacterium]|nr:hypothetical protein [Anaerolineae bacterium]
LTTQVETAAQAALEAAEGALDIASPSGAFMRIGENVVAGMVQGLQHGQPMLAAAIAGMTTPPPVGAASAAGTRAAPAVQDNRTYTYQDYWQPQYAERPSPDQQWHDANLWKLHKRRR